MSEAQAPAGEALRGAFAAPAVLAAREALGRGDFPRAEALLRAQLAREPANAAALFLLAGLAARAGHAGDALAMTARCIELAPDFDGARLEYARLLYRADRPREALAGLDVLLERDPASPAARNLKALALGRVGEHARALPLFEALLAEHPGEAGVWVAYAHALKTIGRTAEAVEAYRRCASLEPWAGDAWWGLANLKTFRFADADLATMRAQLARLDLGEEDRIHLSFALGKALEDRADYEAAFGAYERANALRRARSGWSAERNTAVLRSAADIYAVELFERHAGEGCPAPDPIFVVGMPRAGSTLVEQILASHPLVEGTMELEDLLEVARALGRRATPEESRSPGRYHAVVARLDGAALRAAGERYLETTRVHRKRGTPFFVDKMPNNFAHVGLIRLALPNAKIVDVRRHPMACGFSMFKQDFARGQEFSYSLGDIGRYYRDYVDYMAHFDRVQPGGILRVDYEALVADTEGQVRRLLAHCGLPFDPACLRFFENERPVRTASVEQVRRPVYREALDHWKHFEPWLDPLREALGHTVDS